MTRPRPNPNPWRIDMTTHLPPHPPITPTVHGGPPQVWAGWPVVAPAYPAAAVIRVDRNGPGTAGLVLGVIGLVMSVVPIVGMVAWAIWPVGVILSAVGLQRANQQLATNRGTAVAGLATSLTAAAVCVAWVVLSTAIWGGR